LELETGDVVGAGHASATGRLTTSNCSTCNRGGFQSLLRGQLVVRGFFVDVLNKIDDAELSSSLMRRIESKSGNRGS